MGMGLGGEELWEKKRREEREKKRVKLMIQHGKFLIQREYSFTPCILELRADGRFKNQA